MQRVRSEKSVLQKVDGLAEVAVLQEHPPAPAARLLDHAGADGPPPLAERDRAHLLAHAALLGEAEQRLHRVRAHREHEKRDCPQTKGDH